MMKKFFPLFASVCLLNACSPEQPRHVQQPVASDIASVSEVAKASETTTQPENNSPSTPAVASPVATASAASTPASSNGKALHKGKKVLISKNDENGTTLYYFPESIKKEGKLHYVMTENRFDSVQNLPDETGKPFLYSLIKEAVDCERKLTDPVSVTHFSAKDEVVKTADYPYPDYSTWSALELEALANEHPDAAFINAVCKQKK